MPPTTTRFRSHHKVAESTDQKPCPSHRGPLVGPPSLARLNVAAISPTVTAARFGLCETRPPLLASAATSDEPS